MKKWISYILASSLLFAAVPPFFASAAETAIVEAAETTSSGDPSGKLTVKDNDITVTLTIPQTISSEITSLHFQLKVSVDKGGMDIPKFTFKSANTSSDTPDTPVQDVSIKQQEDGSYIADIIISGKKEQLIFKDTESVEIGTLSLSPTTSEFKATAKIVEEVMGNGTDNDGTDSDETDNENQKMNPVVEYVTSNGQTVQKVFLQDTGSVSIPDDTTENPNPNNPTTPDNPNNPTTPDNPSNPANPSTPGGSFGGSPGVVTPAPETPADTTENVTSPTDTNNTPSDSNNNTINTPTEPNTNSDKIMEVGEKVTVDNANYEITSSNEQKKEVAYLGAVKKKKSVTIPSTITINDVVYTVTEIANRAFAGDTKMKSVSIPATVVKIGNFAFKNCKKLNKIVIPKKVEIIGKKAFFGCKAAASLTFKGNKVTRIGQEAFSNNIKIKKVSIPTSVKRIKNKAFNGCKNLKTIMIPSKKITVIGKNSFKGISKKAVIKVPAAKQKFYTKLLRNSGYKGTIKKI